MAVQKLDGAVMILTIELSGDEGKALVAKAAAEGLTLTEWIRKLADQSPRATERRRRISETIRENMSRVPPEILATMPKDGASEHDHYIYGLPKRNP